jgi:hypothetical protein
MNKHSLVDDGRTGKHYDHGWQSRDTKDIDCKATGCLFNRAETCMVPTRCQINATGGCAGFEPVPLPAKLDGD